jgi:Putative DNA-binding domain
MHNLAHIQRRVSALIMQQRFVDGNHEIGQLIAPNARLSSRERLEIYHDQYWARILSSFTEDFEGLRAVLGERKFQTVARAYLTACPSTSFTLRNLGSLLEPWAEANERMFSPFSRLALDMIRLEWAHIDVFDSPSKPPLDSPEVPLALQPYIRLLTVHHAVDDLLLEARAIAGELPPRKRIAQYASQTRIVHLVVHRWDNSVYYKTIEPEAHGLLTAIASRQSLHDAVASLPDNLQFETVQQWFTEWAQAGWLCARE